MVTLDRIHNSLFNYQSYQLTYVGESAEISHQTRVQVLFNTD